MGGLGNCESEPRPRAITSRTKDLATDADFYNLDISYDENSNPTVTEDQVHYQGWDVAYSLDDLDRVTSAEEGTWNGSSIPDDTRHQEWTLDHLGNWNLAKWDLNGDGDWSDTDEYQDDRTHNTVNELTGRDTDDNGTDDYTLAYDGVGNLTDDGENYTYEWDAFGRLRKVKNRSTSALVAEYRYNGLGHRIAEHVDTDDDGDVDASDKWYYFAYDEDWRWLATFREDDSDPKEEFVVQHAGLDGAGGSSYINGVVLRDKDANTAWTDASDGTLENRVYYCQNWRGDVSALVTATGKMVEWVKYSAYGVPFGMPSGDADSDGDFDSADQTAIQALIDTSSYEVRADQDLDGDVDASDKVGSQRSLGLMALSGIQNWRGSASWVMLSWAIDAVVYSDLTARSYHSGLGRGSSRIGGSGYSIGAPGQDLGSGGWQAGGEILRSGGTMANPGCCPEPGGACAWAFGVFGEGEGIFVNHLRIELEVTSCDYLWHMEDYIEFWEVLEDRDAQITDQLGGGYEGGSGIGRFSIKASLTFFPKGCPGYDEWKGHLDNKCSDTGPLVGGERWIGGAWKFCMDTPKPAPEPPYSESGSRVYNLSWVCCPEWADHGGITGVEEVCCACWPDVNPPRAYCPPR